MSKLIRDLIPEEILKTTGQSLSVTKLTSPDFLRVLLDKLIEEAQELRRDPGVGELVDVAEVISYLKHQLQISDQQLNQAVKAKRQQRGGFDQRLLAPFPVKHLPDAMLIQKCLLLRAGLILILQRQPTDRSRPNCWDLPGGGYEVGENVINSLTREVKEETGVIIHNARPFHFANQIGVKSGLYYGDHVFAVCYVCDQWEGKLNLSDEHVAYRWVTPQEFLTYDFGEDKGFFKDSINLYMEIITPK
ncbi:MAG: Bifunctional acetyltransferase [Microgenomates group bacterium GW2011_GWC2_46_7]|nr:MAG: Bifunctional acetyltransferase [Microgenomates group bacterium GW2011_GWC2_46_7]